MKRIVITGMGVVSPLGVGVETVWQRLLEGKSGIRRLLTPIGKGVTTEIAGFVPDLTVDPEAGFDPERYLTAKELRRLDEFTIFAIAAAEEAVKQSGWHPLDAAEQQHTATIVGTGVGGINTIMKAVRTIDAQGAGRLSPFTVPAFLSNLAAGQLAIKHGYKGPLGTPVAACAAGLQAIGDGMRIIRSGEAEIALCGGTEAAINEVGLGGFMAAKALTESFNLAPEKASRPFDAWRDGFVMSEGAGMVMIESLEHAQERGAVPIAELIGYGTSSDAYHITSGPEDGAGALQAMQGALKQGGVTPTEVGYINAHATSTQVGDKGELVAIKRLFGSENAVAVSSTKSSMGHMLGAAGGVAAILTALSLRDQIAPVNLNCSEPDEDAAGVDLVLGEARKMAMEYALCNAFGFGGVNASLLLKRWDEK